MIVTVDDMFLNIMFDDLSIINDIKRLNSLLGGKTMSIVSGDYNSRRKGEARFYMSRKYKSHILNHLQEQYLVAIHEEAEKSSIKK